MEDGVYDYSDWGIYGAEEELKYMGTSNIDSGVHEKSHEEYYDDHRNWKHENENSLGYVAVQMSNKGVRETVVEEGTARDQGIVLGVHPDMLEWNNFMTLFHITKIAKHLSREDILNREFNSVEEAEKFFNLYAKLTGFSVRRGHKRKRVNGEMRMQEWLCSREGASIEKFLNKLDRVREPKAITRVGCKVAFRILKRKDNLKWITKEFVTEHSHPLAHPAHVQFLRSNRIVSGSTIEMAMAMKGSGIRTCHIMTYMAEQAGGFDKLPYLSKDMRNRITRYEMVELSDADASRAIGYLQHKADHDMRFYGKFSYDDYLRLENVIWADSKRQQDYASFGHARI